VEHLKYLGTTLTNQNSIQEEIKRGLKSGNACYHLVLNLLSSSLLFKNIKIKIYGTIILPVVLYGCETWWLTMRGECRLGVSENSVLRTIFGPKRDAVKWECRRLHTEELNDLYFSPIIIQAIKLRRTIWVGHVACKGERRGAYRIVVGKPEEQTPLGKPRCRWEDNIKKDLQGAKWGDMDWIDLAQDRTCIRQMQ